MIVDLESFKAQLNELKRKIIVDSAADSDHLSNEDCAFIVGQSDFHSSAYFEASLRNLESEIELNNSPLSVTSLRQYYQQEYDPDETDDINSERDDSIFNMHESIGNFHSLSKGFEDQFISLKAMSIAEPLGLEHERQQIFDLSEDDSESASVSSAQSASGGRNKTTISHTAARADVDSGEKNETSAGDDDDDSINFLEKHDLVSPLRKRKKVFKDDALHASAVSMSCYESCRSNSSSAFDIDHDASSKHLLELGIGNDESFSNFHSPLKDHGGKFTSRISVSVLKAPTLVRHCSDNSSIIELEEDDSEDCSVSSAQAESAVTTGDMFKVIGNTSPESTTTPTSNSCRLEDDGENVDDDENDGTCQDDSLDLAEVDDLVLPLQSTSRHSTKETMFSASITSMTAYDSATSNDLDDTESNRTPTPFEKPKALSQSTFPIQAAPSLRQYLHLEWDDNSSSGDLDCSSIEEKCDASGSSPNQTMLNKVSLREITKATNITPRTLVEKPIDGNQSMVNFFSPLKDPIANSLFRSKLPILAAPSLGQDPSEDEHILDLHADDSNSSSDDDSSSDDEDSYHASNTRSHPGISNKKALSEVARPASRCASFDDGPPPLEESKGFSLFIPLGTFLSNLAIKFSTPPSDLRLKDLQRLKILGEGQFGQVWLVSDKHRRAYALKIFAKYDLIQSGEVDMIIHEAEIHQQIQDHPFIVKLVSVFQDEHMIYMMQDFAQGGELFSVIEHYSNMNNGGMPEYQAKFYACCIADAIGHMHSMKVAYRDLKPENCMIDKYGYPLLIDFGYAKHVPDRTYTFCGTPRFLPPEAVYPENGYNCVADHWSLGVLIYEMLRGGVNPFYYDGISELELFTAIQEEEYLPLPEVISANAADIVAGLLTKNPALRLGSSECGTNDILQHAWLSELDLVDLRKRKIQAPWVPETKDALDTTCFDEWDHVEDKFSAKHPKLRQQQENLFKSFKY